MAAAKARGTQCIPLSKGEGQSWYKTAWVTPLTPSQVRVARDVGDHVEYASHTVHGVVPMFSDEIHIREADIPHLPQLAHLFDLYRGFYEQESNEGEGRQSLQDRLIQGESRILIAEALNLLGFVQLYPTFSSISLKRRWLLSDLYVLEEARGLGVGTSLLEAAVELAKASGANGLSLETARDNLPARQLYERLGWKLDETYLSYDISC